MNHIHTQQQVHTQRQRDTDRQRDRSTDRERLNDRLTKRRRGKHTHRSRGAAVWAPRGRQQEVKKITGTMGGAAAQRGGVTRVKGEGRRGRQGG